MRMDQGIGSDDGDAIYSSWPLCGYVGCIGDWTEVLRRGQARKILGLNDVQADTLFYGPLVEDSGQGTYRHARRVVALIQRFQRKYRGQLLATRV